MVSQLLDVQFHSVLKVEIFSYVVSLQFKIAKALENLGQRVPDVVFVFLIGFDLSISRCIGNVVFQKEAGKVAQLLVVRVVTHN